MLKIRLQRVGRKHEPVFRIVLTESQNGPKSGKFHEILGSYDSRPKGVKQIKRERVEYWVGQGVQVSGTVHNLLVDEGVIKGKKINVLPKKTAPKKEEEVKEEPKAEEAPKEEEKTEEAAPEAPVEETKE